MTNSETLKERNRRIHNQLTRDYQMKNPLDIIDEAIDDTGEAIKSSTGDDPTKNKVVDAVKEGVKPLNLVVGVATGALLGGLL